MEDSKRNRQETEQEYQEGLKFLYGQQDVRTDIRKAFEYFHKCADEGHVEGMYQVGKLYWFGEPYVMKNSKAAFKYIKVASEQGLQIAKLQLGDFYLMGIGIDKDVNTAIELYEELVKEGNLVAHDRLMYIYKEGIDVEKNIEKALMHCNFARMIPNNFGAEIAYINLSRER